MKQLVLHSTEPTVPALVAIDAGAGGKLTPVLRGLVSGLLNGASVAV